MAEMTSRERVHTALNHEEPDRVPTALGGGPYSIVDDLYFKLLDALGIEEPVEPFREGHNVSFQDDRILDRLGTDTRYVWPTLSPSSPLAGDGEKLIDGYGQPWNRALPYYYPAAGILEHADGIDAIDELVTWPDPKDPKWTSGVRARAQMLRERTDKFVVARMVTSHGPYQTASDLRGAEQFLMDMAAVPEYAQALTDRVTDSIVGLIGAYLEAGGRYFDMIELPGDDYATQTGLAMSPAMFRRYFKPAIVRMVSTVKTYRSDIRVMFHCDGALTPLLEDLADAGVDVVHPIEPLPASNLDEIKAAYGDRLAFLGAIDIKQALPGSRDEVIEEVKLRISQLARGGGYILAPSNHVQPDVPAENLVALFDAARTYGRYPIKVIEAGAPHA
jgi:uroporphyrinogen decarboxylase